MDKIAIIGAGQAGSTLAGTLRSEGFDGQITLIGSENHLPYQRPPRAKAYLRGEMDRDRLLVIESVLEILPFQHPGYS